MPPPDDSLRIQHLIEAAEKAVGIARRMSPTKTPDKAEALGYGEGLVGDGEGGVVYRGAELGAVPEALVVGAPGGDAGVAFALVDGVLEVDVGDGEDPNL